jgi:hypothetical protein
MGWQDYTIPNETFTCDQVAACWALTKQMYEQHSPWVWGFNLWNVGGQTQWVDLTPCLSALD